MKNNNNTFKFWCSLSLVLPILYFGIKSNDSNDIINFRKGFFAAIILFLISSFVYTQNHKVNWPSPKFGILFTRIGYIYITLLVFLLFQNSKFVKRGFSLFGSNNKTNPLMNEKSYENNCEFNWEEIKDNFDHYYLCHFFGWMILTLIFRDFWYTFLSSILDELIEITFKYILPHLAECWYDQIFHDILFGNLMGIFFGMLIIKLFKLEKFDWFGKKGCKNITEWKFFRNPFRFFYLNILTIIKLFQFLCSFFGMNSLWLLPQSPLTIIRLFIWITLLYLVTREIYYRIKINEGLIKEKIKYKYEEVEYSYLCLTALLLESGIIFKFHKSSGGLSKNPHIKTHSLILWVIYFILFISYSLYLYIKKTKNKKIK